MGRIKYKDLKVPSWSWMTYNGGIKFVEIPYGEMDLFTSVRFSGGDVLITTVWRFDKRCTLNQETAHHVIQASGREIGWIKYDFEEGKELSSERSVVLGRGEAEY
jgi:hypothetical protein